MRIVSLMLLLLPAAGARAESLTIDQAVSLALSRNHDAIAARLDIDAAELDKVQAGLYPNPVFSYTLGNIVAGDHNPQSPAIGPPGPFGQTVHNFTLSDVVDVWAKRNTRLRAADRGIAHKRLMVEDALREIVYQVRSAFNETLREQSELDLARETRVRYDETVRLSRSRFAAGDISEAELRKVELESLRYQNAELDGVMELELARQKLVALLALGLSTLPTLAPPPEGARPVYTVPALVDQALSERPDVRAAKAARLLGEAQLTQARREAFPDITLGLGFTHSEFQVSGDNPNTVALMLSLPLPLFDRNQANIGRAKLDIKRADNEGQRVLAQVQHEVADAVRRTERAGKLLAVFEGGMLERAETALKVAERSYKSGAISLLELLEAQRTHLETRAHYLRVLHDYRQAGIDIRHAVGGTT